MKLSLRYYISKRTGSRLLMEEDSNLLMSLHFGGKRLIFYPGIFLNAAHWNKINQQVVIRPDKERLNILLQNLKKEVKRIFYILNAKHSIVEPAILRKALSEIRIEEQFALTNGLVRYMEEHTNAWSHSSYLKFKSLYNKLCDYESLKGLNLHLEMVDDKFLNSFYEYLRSVGLKSSTLITYMNNLKGVLKYAAKKNWMINRDYRKFKMPKQIKARDNAKLLTYLNYEEITGLYEKQLENRKQEQSRDIFCLMSFTGLRYSEVKALKVNSLVNNSLRIEGSRARTVPLNKFALNILEKYRNKYYLNNSLLPAYSEITVNKYLQDIFQDVKISFFQKEEFQNQKITIASAYNTFMANAVYFGVSPVLVRKWSANKTLSRYSAIKKSIESAEEVEVEKINQQFYYGK